VKKIMPILEQLSVAGGSFLFFILASRIAGPEYFGEFSIIFISSQIIYSIASQWIVVPITSTRIDTSELHLYSSSLTRFFVFIFTIPIVAGMFHYLFMPNMGVHLFIVFVAALSSGLILFDLLRFYNIRINKISAQIKMNILRWLLSLSSVILLSEKNNDLVFVVFISYLIGLIPIFYKQIVLIVEIRPSIYLSKVSSINNFTEHSKTMASLGLSNALFTVVTTVILSRVGVSALGAIQAFRSLVNWAPLLVQHIETHHSAKLINRKKYTFLNIRWYRTFFLFFISVVLFFYLYDEWLILTILGPSYLVYKPALTMIFILVMIQSATRVLGAQARLHNLQHIFKKQVYILILSALFFTFLYFILKIKIDINTLLIFMIITAIIQGGVMLYMLNNGDKV